MDLFKAMGISAMGLNAQRMMIEAVSSNLANVQTTRTKEGGPYRRKLVVLSHVPSDLPFASILTHKMEGYVPLLRTHLDHLPPLEILPWEGAPQRGGVTARLLDDPEGFKMIYDPSHPDADEQGQVYLPNISVIEEMVNLLGAVRGYEANVTAFNAAKNMVMKALEIGR
ncbi:MAG TPA: flagellar basal body rod protein FlgC [Thermodesulfobacteriota bacterium]|nr:flagellar basal body rod protein FlgC [Thermodesulfobacteriota bacterium]